MNPKNKTYKNTEYYNFVKSKPCLKCGKASDAHHVRHAKFNDFLCVPLCRIHHSELHAAGCKRWENANNLCFYDEIINLMAEYITNNI